MSKACEDRATSRASIAVEQTGSRWSQAGGEKIAILDSPSHEEHLQVGSRVGRRREPPPMLVQGDPSLRRLGLLLPRVCRSKLVGLGLEGVFLRKRLDTRSR